MGRPDLTAKLHLIELPVYLTALVVLTKRYGVEGAAIAWSGRCALDMVLLFIAVRRHVHSGSRELTNAEIAIAGSVIASLCAMITLPLPVRGGLLLAALAIFYPVAWQTLISAAERAAIVAQLRRAIGAREIRSAS